MAIIVAVIFRLSSTVVMNAWTETFFAAVLFIMIYAERFHTHTAHNVVLVASTGRLWRKSQASGLCRLVWLRSLWCVCLIRRVITEVSMVILYAVSHRLLKD